MEGKEEARPPSPENIEGRQQAMAEDLLAMPGGEAQALALAELVRRWAEVDLEGVMAFRARRGDRGKGAFHFHCP